MNCPKCQSRLSWKSFVYKKSCCPSCNANFNTSSAVNIIAAILGVIVGLTLQAGHIVFGAFIGVLALGIFILLTPKFLRVEAEVASANEASSDH